MYVWAFLGIFQHKEISGTWDCGFAEKQKARANLEENYPGIQIISMHLMSKRKTPLYR